MQDNKLVARTDMLVDIDSHTIMINGACAPGWGVGGIEAEATMPVWPVSMLIPDVVGFKLVGKLCEGMTVTNLVLTVTQMLRKPGSLLSFMMMDWMHCRLPIAQ